MNFLRLVPLSPGITASVLIGAEQNLRGRFWIQLEATCSVGKYGWFLLLPKSSVATLKIMYFERPIDVVIMFYGLNER